MHCPSCNFDNPPEAKFCGKCGSTIPTPAPPNPPNPQPTGVVSKEMKNGIAIGSVIVPLLGIIMGAIYMNDANPEKKAVGKFWLMVGLGALALQCVCGAIYGASQNFN